MSSPEGTAAVFRRVLSVGEPSNRLLRIGLGVIALTASLAALVRLVEGLPWGVDLVIPLEAAGRWLAGGRAYVPEAFANGPGYDLPFLYPPYALPLFAPLTAVPLHPLQEIWLAVSLAIAVAACRWLGISWKWIPFVLVWPPFAEGLIAGNIQVAVFAAFVLVLHGAGNGGRGPAPGRPASPLARGLLGAASAFLKVSQPHVVVHMLRWDRRAAAVAILAIGSLVAVTLPLTGTSIWMDWIEQLRLAADPGWLMGGLSLARRLSSPLATVVVLACLAAVFFVPTAHAARWVGVLLVLGAPSVHTYYLLFLLPAMLHIRREIALVAALLIATYTEPGWWLGIALVAGALALSRSQAGLLERANGARVDDLEAPPAR
jgi:hypothetical protein